MDHEHAVTITSVDTPVHVLSIVIVVVLMNAAEMTNVRRVARTQEAGLLLALSAPYCLWGSLFRSRSAAVVLVVPATGIEILAEELSSQLQLTSQRSLQQLQHTPRPMFSIRNPQDTIHHLRDLLHPTRGIITHLMDIINHLDTINRLRITTNLHQPTHLKVVLDIQPPRWKDQLQLIPPLKLKHPTHHIQSNSEACDLHKLLYLAFW